jgi:hypothetical protein
MQGICEKKEACFAPSFGVFSSSKSPVHCITSLKAEEKLGIFASILFSLLYPESLSSAVTLDSRKNRTDR